MSVPDYQSLMRPLLAYGQDGGEKNINETIAAIANHLRLSDDDRALLVPSGKQTLLGNRVHWARTYLDKAGAIRRTRRSHFQITERGQTLLKENPERIATKTLRQFNEFLEFQNKSVGNNEEGNENAVGLQVADTKTPEENILIAEEQISSQVRAELLDRIAELSPAFFERLVVDLIVSMGYGGSRSNVAKSIGKSGDEGIDGIVNEDPLGLDVVYIQAKRYAADNKIGRERIQQFAGALVGQGASKGVFVTTSGFSSGAIEYARKVPQRIILIDGEELTRLMLQYGVGVRTEKVIELKRIDVDYFSEGGGID
jgi:restriction system protein